MKSISCYRADPLHQVFSRMVDKLQVLDYICNKEDKSISMKQAGVLAHKPPVNYGVGIAFSFLNHRSKMSHSPS